MALRLQQKCGMTEGVLQVEDMSRIQVENGFSYAGKDMLTSGITREPLEAYVYFVPIYYQVRVILCRFSILAR